MSAENVENSTMVSNRATSLEVSSPSCAFIVMKKLRIDRVHSYCFHKVCSAQLMLYILEFKYSCGL